MLNIGCHLSASKGFSHMAKEAISINANTFQFFTRNPRGFAAKDIDAEKWDQETNSQNIDYNDGKLQDIAGDYLSPTDELAFTE